MFKDIVFKLGWFFWFSLLFFIVFIALVVYNIFNLSQSQNSVSFLMDFSAIVCCFYFLIDTGRSMYKCWKKALEQRD